MAEEDKTAEHRLTPDLLPPGGGTGDPPTRTHPKPTPGPVIPPFQPANYTFRLENMQIQETRSVHEDSDKVSFSVAVGVTAPITLTKDMGDHNSGTYPIGLSIGPIPVTDPNVGIAMNYLIVNSGYQNWSDINKAIAAASSAAAAAGARAATAAIGTAVGAELGSDVMPIVGTILGAIAGWLAGQITGIIVADCDGPVAAEQPALKGQQLWANTVNGVWTTTTVHFGLDSNWGCGVNSMYKVTWSVTRS